MANTPLKTAAAKTRPPAPSKGKATPSAAAKTKKAPTATKKTPTAATTTGSASATLQEKNAELEKQVIEIQAALAKEKALREAAEKGATAKKATHLDNTLSKIPKPKGSAGNGFKLIEAMQLEDNEQLYHAIIREVHELSIQAGLDYRDDFKDQPVEALGLLYKLARDIFPVLERFPNDWATAEMTKQYLYNKRKHSVAKGYIPQRAERQKAKAAGKVAMIQRRRKQKVMMGKENIGTKTNMDGDEDNEDDPMGEQEDNVEVGDEA